MSNFFDISEHAFNTTSNRGFYYNRIESTVVAAVKNICFFVYIPIDEHFRLRALFQVVLNARFVDQVGK